MDMDDFIEALKAELMKLPEDIRQELMAPYAEKYVHGA